MSSAVTPEAQTIENCTPQLEIAFKEDRDLVHYLKKEGFIKKSLSEDVLDPKSSLTEVEKAGKLVQAVKDAVSLDHEMFHALVDQLKISGRFYKSIVKKLTEEFKSLSQEGHPQQNTTHQTNGGANASNGLSQNAGTYDKFHCVITIINCGHG